jgi:23S rRNA pseudouridine1911/1915/1917 synthase
VVGDARYGGDRPTLPAPRPFLHAARLGFRHPATGEGLAFDSPLPADLEAVVSTLSSR